MSGSETGVISSGSNISMGKPPAQAPAGSSQPVIQNMHLAYGGADGNAMYKRVNSPPYQGTGNGDGLGPGSMGLMGGVGEPLKKKRGRPRKYGSDGSMATMPLSSAPPQPSGAGAFSPPPPPPPPQPQQPPSQPQPVTGAPGSPQPLSFKKARGRPPGSSKKQQLEALGSPGIGFTPHVITVKAGEDVASKIMSFSQNGPRAICILSAIGAISNVTLRQAATSGGSVTYEGRFEILSLSGSFMLSDSGGHRSRSGGLSVSLAGPDGRVLGGGVAGLLTAASPVQVVVGSFIADGRREINIGNQMEPLSAPSKLHGGIGPTGGSSPTSRGTLSESSGGGGSPLNHGGAGAVNSNPPPPGMSGLPWK